MSKAKGSSAERELLRQFWDNGWAALRVAGSGSTQLAAPDIIAGTKGRVLVIECKAVKAAQKYFSQEDIDQITLFADRMGAEAWLGIRFDRKGWFFVTPNELTKSGKMFRISRDDAMKIGRRLDVLMSMPH